VLLGRGALAVYRADPTATFAPPGGRASPPGPPAPPLPGPMVYVTANGLPLLAVNADRPWPTASTGKIMTAYVVLQDPTLPLDRTIRITQADVAQEDYGYQQGYSEVPLNLGETYTVRDLLYALMLPSADDAAQVLARASRWGAEGFVAEMNATARRLGLTHSHFTSPAGVLTSNVSSARDLVRLTQVALTNPTFARVVRTKYYTMPHVGRIGNLNWMLWNVTGAIGVKTGWTSVARHALVFAVERPVAGRPVLVVGAVLGSPRTFQATFHTSRTLVDWAYRDLYLASVPAGEVGRLDWGHGVSTRLYVPAASSFILPRGVVPRVTYRLDAPSFHGDAVAVGTVTIRAAGQTLARLPLLSTPPPAWFADLYAIGRFLARL
jgi:D-alanyl-D-alanine carboxypeptidase (penicillin-binding protein 5/6)